MSTPLTTARPRPAGTAPAEVRRLLLNAASLVGAYVVPRLFTFLAVVVAARVLGPAEFGAYGTAAAFAVILSIVATLGMTPLLVRELVRGPDRAGELLAAAHLVKVGSNAVMLLALVALAHGVLGYPSAVVGAALLLGVGYAVGAFAENLGAWFQAAERMHVWLQASAAFGVVTGASGVLLVWTTGSVVWFCAAPVAGQLAALAWLLGRLPPGLRRRPGAVRRDDVVRLARALVPFAAAFVLLTVFYKVDVLLLTRWRAAADVGAYVAAYKFIDGLHALALAAIVAVYPRLARNAPPAGNRDRWTAGRVAELALLAAVPAGGALWLLRAEAVHWLFGADYAGSVAALGLLALAVPPLALNLLAGYILGATGRMGLLALGYGVAVVLKVGLNAGLVPDHGATGAAASMLTAEIALAIALVAVLRTTSGAAPGVGVVGVAGTAAAAAVLVGLAAPVLVGPAAAVAYLGVVALLYWRAGALAPRERAALRQALRP